MIIKICDLCEKSNENNKGLYYCPLRLVLETTDSSVLNRMEVDCCGECKNKITTSKIMVEIFNIIKRQVV